MTKDRKKDDISSRYRGIILDKMVHIESAIEFIIGWTFCKPEMVIPFIGLVMTSNDSKLTFNSKVVIYGFILKHFHQEFILQHPKHMDTLLRLIEKRNVIAHRKSFYDEKTETLSFTWTTAKKNNPRIDNWELNDQSFQDFVKGIDAIMKEIGKIFLKLDPKRKP